MSIIRAIDDFTTGTWVIEFIDVDSTYADLQIGFTDNATVIEFKNLKFGYELKHSNGIQQYGVFPPYGVKYIRTDQPYITSVRLIFEQDTDYTLWLWCENDGKRFENSFIFRPSKV